MDSKLPYEVLEHIFTFPIISKRDLLQLTLTCKQWSPIAQKHLYREFNVDDYDLYSIKATLPHLNQRIEALTRTLLLVDIQVNRFIRTIDFGGLFSRYANLDPTEDSLLQLATLVQLCPQLTASKGRDPPAGFYDFISNLHRSGGIQHLEYIEPPSINALNEDNKEGIISSYYKAAASLKDTLKEIVILDIAGRTTENETWIQPAYLDQFSSLEEVHFQEFSRFHLSRFKEYISHCSLGTKSINFYLGYKAAAMDRDQSAVIPQTQVRQLAIVLNRLPLTPAEMDHIMQMFPSLEYCFSGLHIYDKEELVPILQQDMELAMQFLNYLFMIPRVDFTNMWFGVSEGLTLLPHISNSIDIQTLSIVSMHPEGLAAVLLAVNRETRLGNTIANEEQMIETKSSFLGIDVYSNNPQASLGSALEAFKNKPITSAIVGPADYYYHSTIQHITEQSMDYFTNEYTALQKLTYNHIEFPLTEPPLVTSKRRKYLQCLHLYHCKITEDYFAKLSCQFEYLDCFKFTTPELRHIERDQLLFNETNFKIFLPYTTVNIIEVDLGEAAPYMIKIWANHTCTILNDNPPTKTQDSNPTYHYEIIVHCLHLNEIRTPFQSHRLL